MICKQCGASNKDGSGFCSACGAAIQAESPKKQKLNQEMTDLLDKVSEYWRWIIAAFAVVVFILGIMNLFCALPVFEVARQNGQVARDYVSVSTASEHLRTGNSSFALGIIANILFGLTNLTVAGVGVFYFLKKERNLTYYDQYIAKFIKTDEPAFLMGVAGAGTAVIQIVLYMLCGVKESVLSTGVSVGVHWLNWVALVLYGGLIALSILMKKKEA